MSMMEALSQIRERAREKKKQNEPLPWFCLILSDRCIEPEKTCMECGVYQKHKEELEHGNQDADDTKRGWAAGQGKGARKE